MKLGTSADGRSLTYDHSRYEFRLAKQPVSFDDVRALESRDWIRWRAPELREWFVKIDRDAFIACNRAAHEQVAPARPQTSLIYRSSNPAVASVDAAGRVTVRGNGTADIIAARPTDTEFVSAVRLVTVVSTASSACEVRESFKSKGGVLAKDKSFRLPVLPEGADGYEKVSGSDSITVSPSGKVTVGKGTRRGLHTAEIAMRGAEPGTAGFATALVTVEVR